MAIIKTPEQIFNRKQISGYINPDFKWCEFVFPEDGIPPLEHLKNLVGIATVLSVYKHKVFNGAIVRITSGYRSMAHHLRVYKELGITDLKKIPMGSYHLKGLAADFTVDGYTKKQVYDLMNIYHFGGVEYPDNQNRTHIDNRGKIERFQVSTGKSMPSKYDLYQHNRIFHS